MNIAVYCGSAPGNKPEFTEGAARLAKWIAQSGNTVVFGGTKFGLMGTVADTALENGGKVIGVLPELEYLKERQHQGLSEYVYKADMAARRSKMIELADAYVALPGGPGTLDEISEVLCLARLGIDNKPCIFFNTNGFYDSLVKLFDEMIDNEFSTKNDYRNVLVSDDIEKIEEFITSHF